MILYTGRSVTFAVIVLLVVNLQGAETAVNNVVKMNECAMNFKDTNTCACSNTTMENPMKCCEDGTIEIQLCYCMYYDSEQNMSILGHCFFTCFANTEKFHVSNTSTFNKDMCAIKSRKFDLNRRGRFCGECKESYGLAVYSYQYYSCVQCTDYGYKNWLKYFAVALFPLTVIYILVIIFKLNVTSSTASGIVTVLQCMTSPMQMRVIQASYFAGSSYRLVQIILTICCMANLDFFRIVYHPFCLHPKVNILHIVSLDYIVALYPFILILITYGLVSLYDREYRLLVWMWKPFKWCLHHYHKQWNIRTSLIEMFATFMLLSYVKILGVCFDLLTATLTYDIYGNRLKNKYLYYNANIEYFGPRHLPFALLALFMGFAFVFLPFLLLVIYPSGCFQRCLNHTGWRCWTLHVFMDAFQGSYKIKPHDYRYFSAYYLLLRIILLSQIQLFPSDFFFYTSGIVIIISAVGYIVFQPYKVNAHNKIDSILLLFLALYFISIHELKASLSPNQRMIALLFITLSVIILVLYLILLITWRILKVNGTSQKLKFLWQYIVHKQRESIMEASIETFDRDIYISRSSSYPPLLQGTQKLVN